MVFSRDLVPGDEKILPYIGKPQIHNLDKMTQDIGLRGVWEGLLGGDMVGLPSQNRLPIWEYLKVMTGGMTMTGSVVRETYPRLSEGRRKLTTMIDSGLLNRVKELYFRGDGNLATLTPDQYLGVKLMTYLLEKNVDIRFDRNQWSDEEAGDVIQILASTMSDTTRLGSRKWYASKIRHSDDFQQLHFGSTDIDSSGINFYFKRNDVGGRGRVTTSMWEIANSAREWIRQLQIIKTEEGIIKGESKGMLGLKDDIRNQLEFDSVGMRGEFLARAIREVAMTGRMAKNLKIDTFGDESKLENSWTLKQWLMYVSNLSLAFVQDPKVTKELLLSIGFDQQKLSSWPDTQDEVVEELLRGKNDEEGQWSKLLVDTQTTLVGGVGAHGVESNKQSKITNLSQLTRLIELFSPISFEEAVKLVPQPEDREKIEPIQIGEQVGRQEMKTILSRAAKKATRLDTISEAIKLWKAVWAMDEE